MRYSITGLSVFALGALTMGTGCAGVTIQPGHRALYFDPGNGGVQHEVLQPGWYRTACPFWVPDNKCPRVDDFDVTYSTSKEEMHTLSSEGLPLSVHIAVAYRPIVSELYQLDTEIGANYFDEVIGPEFRSAAIGVFAHSSYQDLQRKNGRIEDEIEKALRDRLKGKHIEISSVLIEKVTYAPEILQSQKERVVSLEDTLRKKQILENEALQTKRELELHAETSKLRLETQAAQKKMELATQTEQQKMELQARAEEEKFRIDSEMRNKQAEMKLTLEEARIQKARADADATTKITIANGEATSRLALAKATAAEKQAEAANITPNQVAMHAYDSLGQLGGSGTTIMLGDWSKLPGWLFPKVNGFQSAFSPWYGWSATPASGAPAAPGAGPTMSRTIDNPYHP